MTFGRIRPLALLFALAVSPAVADGILDRPQWMGADKISPVDKAAVREAGPMEQILDPKVTKEDEIVPGILLLGTFRNSTLVVRFFSNQPCGRFAYSLFGPAAGDRRPRLHQACADDLHLVHMPGQRTPDILLTSAQGKTRLTQSGQGWAVRP